MPNSDDVTFLTLDQIHAIHADQLERYGGRPGVRDAGLLEAAVAMPAAAFGGEPMHPTLYDKAAAYLFHLARNHPFIDGNKRVGAVAALVLLMLHDIEIEADDDDLAGLVEDVAQGRHEKPAIAAWLERHTHV